jgi:hypothetical protein
VTVTDLRDCGPGLSGAAEASGSHPARLQSKPPMHMHQGTQNRRKSLRKTIAHDASRDFFRRETTI